MTTSLSQSGWPTLQPAPGEFPTVATAITKRMREHPERMAIGTIGSERSLSYGGLDRWSSAIAALLAGWGVGPGCVVAVYGDRSVESVAALVGVMRAGGA